MLRARFRLLGCSSFPIVAQKNPLPKIAPGYANKSMPPGGPWGGHRYTRGSPGMGRRGGAAWTGSALSPGGSPKQNSQDKTVGAGCCWGCGSLTPWCRHVRSRGATTTLVGCIAPTPAMPWERDPVTQCHLKEGLSLQT